jgi:DNA-binding MarR family transcriptional regulator
MAQSSSSSPAAPLDDLLCFSIYAAGLAFNRVYKPILDRFGITYPQYLALTALMARDGQTVGELSETLFLESSTVTPLIKRLESGGLVSRTRDQRDERVVRLALTDTGRSLATEAHACIPDQIRDAVGLDSAGLSDLNARLRSLGAVLRERGATD